MCSAGQKAYSEATIQSEVKGHRQSHQDEKQQVEERREREQRNRMHSIETLLRSHHSVGRESDTVFSGREGKATQFSQEAKTQAEETDKETKEMITSGSYYVLYSTYYYVIQILLSLVSVYSSRMSPSKVCIRSGRVSSDAVPPTDDNRTKSTKPQNSAHRNISRR
jgi:hypothetical protein